MTDAAVVDGPDRSRLLPRRHDHRSIATRRWRAIAARLCGPLGFSVDEAAAGIYRLTTVQMANAIRALTVNRGHDPREFTMVSFGGACGLFAAEIARECDVGARRGPGRARRCSRPSACCTPIRSSRPCRRRRGRSRRPRRTSRPRTRACRRASRSGSRPTRFPAGSREVVREADMKFAGQVFEVTTRLPDEALHRGAQGAGASAVHRRLRDASSAPAPRGRRPRSWSPTRG